MTEITLEKEQHTQIHLSPMFFKGLAAFLMLIALLGSVSLLDWAITNKFAKFEVAESSQITAEVRERQLACLSKNIYYEAGSEPFEGKVAVAQVTLNRTESGNFPSDICRTIYQKNVIYEKVICQFSWTCDRVTGPPAINKANFAESEAVAKKVLLEGFRLPGLNDAMYYHADYVNPGWKREKVAKIGRHIFYK